MPWLALLVALLPVGCVSVHVESDWVRPEVDLARLESYAWLEVLEPGAGDEVEEDGEGDDRPQVAASMVEAVDAELARRGMRRVEARDATLFLTLDLDVAVHRRAQDPYFTQQVAEEVEQGVLTIEVLDTTGELLWWGTGTSRVRVSARAVGVSTLHWVKTEEPREWDVETLVEAVLDAYPRGA